MIQGQAESSADTPRIRDAFPLAFFPPGVSPFSLQHQLDLPELSPQFLQPGSWAAFYQPFTCLCLPAVFAASRNLPLSQSVVFFSTESLGHCCRVGKGAGRGGAGIFIAQSHDCDQWEGRSIAVSHHQAESRSLLCWGFIWNFTRSLFPAQC